MLRPVMAERTGTNLDNDIYPWLLAASAVAAVRLAVMRWAALDTDRDDAVRRLDSAFAHLQDGLNAPRPALVAETTHPKSHPRRTKRHPAVET